MTSTTKSDTALKDTAIDQDAYLDEVPDDIEMSLFDASFTP